MLRGSTLVVKKICSRGMPEARIASAQGCSLRYARAESTWRYPVRKAWRVTDSVISAGLSRLIQACTCKHNTKMPWALVCEGGSRWMALLWGRGNWLLDGVM